MSKHRPIEFPEDREAFIEWATEADDGACSTGGGLVKRVDADAGEIHAIIRESHVERCDRQGCEAPDGFKFCRGVWWQGNLVVKECRCRHCGREMTG